MSEDILLEICTDCPPVSFGLRGYNPCEKRMIMSKATYQEVPMSGHSIYSRRGYIRVYGKIYHTSKIQQLEVPVEEGEYIMVRYL